MVRLVIWDAIAPILTSLYGPVSVSHKTSYHTRLVFAVFHTVWNSTGVFKTMWTFNPPVWRDKDFVRFYLSDICFLYPQVWRKTPHRPQCLAAVHCTADTPTAVSTTYCRTNSGELQLLHTVWYCWVDTSKHVCLISPRKHKGERTNTVHCPTTSWPLWKRLRP